MLIMIRHNRLHRQKAADQVLALIPEYESEIAFASEAGKSILENRVSARNNVGVHVPQQIPGNPLSRPLELRDADLFTRPTETRSLR